MLVIESSFGQFTVSAVAYSAPWLMSAVYTVVTNIY